MPYDPAGTDVQPSTPDVWAKDILRSHKKSGFWSRFIGPEGSGMPVIQKTELLNKPGDLIHISVTAPLAGAGKRGDEILVGGSEGAKLEGYEENLTSSQIKAQPELQRHAVRFNRRMDKRNIIDLRAEAKMRLSEWGMVRFDEERFRFFQSVGTSSTVGNIDEVPVTAEAYTPNNFFAGAAGTLAGMLGTDTLTVKVLQRIKLALIAQNAQPFNTKEGEEIFFLVVSPEMAYGLKRDTEYQSYVRDARERGTTNPIFTGSVAMIDGIVVYQHSRVRHAVETPPTPDIDVGRGIAFGREAFLEALDENVGSKERDFDYGLELGISYEFAFQPRRALEFNSLQVYASNVVA